MIATAIFRTNKEHFDEDLNAFIEDQMIQERNILNMFPVPEGYMLVFFE